jgi:hypothetical protein
MSCARRTLSEGSCVKALELLRQIDGLDDVRDLTAVLVTENVTA